MRKKLEDGDFDLEDAIGRIERNVVRCDRIIDELLEFGSFRRTEPQPVRIVEWLGNLLDQQAVPEGVTVIRDFRDDDAVWQIDTEAMRRVIINLYDNACQAMTSMSGAEACTQRLLTVVVRNVDDRLAIEFRDTGVGIPEDVLPRLFEPMFSTKNFGVGLGLPIVDRVVGLHGGSIEIVNNDTGGATARLLLPLSTDGLADAVSPEARRNGETAD